MVALTAASEYVWRSAATSSTADSLGCPITRNSCYRPPPIADGSPRQQDPPHQDPKVPAPDVPAQRRPAHASRRMDDTRENKATKQHVQTAVHHQQHAGPG